MNEQASTVTTVPSRATPLHALHVELGGRMVDFAGWDLPIQYEGVIAEHTACRERAALFDVSHMGIVELRSSAGTEATSDAFETLTPASIATIAESRQRYALLTNEAGGVIDDCIVTNRGDHLMVVVNASRREADVAHFQQHLDGIEIVERDDLALLALQGPQAVTALSRLNPSVADLIFLDFATIDLNLLDDAGSIIGAIEGVGISRSGYTGEDGFELMVPGDRATDLARSLLSQPEVSPTGLGARDTLRLEAGLALYGNDLDETTTPVEADLVWTMPKRRREDRRFLGSERIMADYDNGPARKRVGLKPSGRRPVRDGTMLRTAEDASAGIITSGGYGPTVEGPVAMGYVPIELAVDGQPLIADVRGNDVEIHVAPLPFAPHHYHRGS